MISLGFDTSNYTTSVAAVETKGAVLADVRKLLVVKHGERGLRQSEAVFQHVNNLPVLLEELFHQIGNRRDEICCVSASVRPRPVEGSYMPVFQAGAGTASAVSNALGVPCYSFSHQEGHIAAIRQGSKASGMHRFITFHLSGGTTEAVLVEDSGIEAPTFEIVGGTRDISYGQVLDRVAVTMGLDFPGGKALDEIAVQSLQADQPVPRIKVEDGYFHLSGLESHCQRVLASQPEKGEALVHALFFEIGQSMITMVRQLRKKYSPEGFLFAGGVASSTYIRGTLSEYEDVIFGEPALSGDNAVGIAFLGGHAHGGQTHHCFTTE